MLSVPYQDFPIIADSPSECRLPNGAIVYGIPAEQRELHQLVNEFPTLWTDTGFVNVPEHE